LFRNGESGMREPTLNVFFAWNCDVAFAPQHATLPQHMV